MKLIRLINAAVNLRDKMHLHPMNGIGTYGCYGKIIIQDGFCNMNLVKSKKIIIVCHPGG